MESCEPEIILTEKIRSYFPQVLESGECGTTLKREITKILDNSDQKTLSFSFLREIHNILKTDKKANSSKPIYLHEMIDNSGISLPMVKPLPRNPELEARIEKLKAQQANKEYREMTKNVDLREKYKGDRIGDDIKSMNRQLIAVFNFIITVVGAFAFGFKAVEYSYGDTLALKMMSGLIFGTVVLFADLYFLVKYSAE